jgi:hypothetical protein
MNNRIAAPAKKNALIAMLWGPLTCKAWNKKTSCAGKEPAHNTGDPKNNGQDLRWQHRSFAKQFESNKSFAKHTICRGLLRNGTRRLSLSVKVFVCAAG